MRWRAGIFLSMRGEGRSSAEGGEGKRGDNHRVYPQRVSVEREKERKKHQKKLIV